MLRLLLRLLNIRDFEVCASCETLKKQLEFERAEKKLLTDTLLEIVHPKPVVIEEQTREFKPIVSSGGLFSRRRAALEEMDRQKAAIQKNSPHIAKPDIEQIASVPSTQYNQAVPVQSVEELEKELELEEKANV